MKIIIGADHGGFKLKEHVKKLLKEKGVEVVDYGTDSEESVDYSPIALKVAEAVVAEEANGILICGTGIGMDIAANRVKGVRATLAHDEFTAKMSKQHNNSNILCMGGRTTDEKTADVIVNTWLETPFSNEDRHERRLNVISDYENS